MKLKNAISAALLLFVFGSLAYMVFKEIGRGAGESPSSAATGGMAALDGVDRIGGIEPEVVVYFFYGDVSCSTCEKLEAYAFEALETHFPDELKSGVLAWRRLNMDAPEHEHYLTEFGLYSKSVVLAGFEKGEQVRFKNLEDIWDLVYDKPAYLEYIQDNARDFLGAAP